MARINVEDSIYRDFRFIKLMNKVGIDAALGKLVRAWSLAQKHFLEHEGVVPTEEWLESDLDDLVTFKLAEVRDEGVYVKGTRDNFAWLKQRQECGRLGGRPKKTGGNLPVIPVKLPVRDETGSNPLTLTPTLTHTLNTPTGVCNARARTRHTPKKSQIIFEGFSNNEEAAAVWISYRRGYQERYGIFPTETKDTFSLCKELCVLMGPDRARIAAFHYPRQSKPFYLKVAHDLKFLLQDAGQFLGLIQSQDWKLPEEFSPKV